MALSPVSNSPLFSPSQLRTPTAEPVSAPTQGMPDLQGTQTGNSLGQLFQADGFDSPMSPQKAGGLEAVAQMLSQLAQVLAASASMLSGEGGAGGQGLSGQESPLSGLSGACKGVEVPEIGGADGGVPEIGGGEEGAPGLEAAPLTRQELPKAEAQKPEAQKNVSKPQQAAAPAGGGPKTGNTMTFTNDGTSPMTVKFTPNAGDKEIASLTLKPGETLTQQFPEGWSGNFRSTAGDGTAATLGEVKFNGGSNQTYYDVSYIEGNNAAMTIQPEEGGRLSGTMDDLLGSAPDSIKAKNADGNAYGIKKSTTSNVQDPGVVDYYRKHVGADQGYVIPTDDASTLGSSDTNLSVHLKNLD
ncbi:hypothetical protein [Vitiosangium sp. GDMCC 1.1324]|uniref:hypothetical protein n=1 Tax=Vitiosangium sp. (strain GDMCC 1.1324) TaxID=2138576 RepID=UPI000D3B45A4|nr:hypothetical protein [Vitiosangium sp. GDMCC 1.1324]PTL76238.1 hypothetical protein DAT35_50225 [Vitiosangium sp. GDMCC 1.1324]